MAIAIEALKILPNVSPDHRHLGKRIGVNYGVIWNIAKAEGIKLIRYNPRLLRRRQEVG